FVIVPFLVRRVDAVTDEHQLSINVNSLSLGSGERDKIVGKLKRLRAVLTDYAKFSFRIGFHAYQRYRLPETSLRARPFQAQRLKLFCDIERGSLAAFRAGA